MSWRELAEESWRERDGESWRELERENEREMERANGGDTDLKVKQQFQNRQVDCFLIFSQKEKQIKVRIQPHQILETKMLEQRGFYGNESRD